MYVCVVYVDCRYTFANTTDWNLTYKQIKSRDFFDIQPAEYQAGRYICSHYDCVAVSGVQVWPVTR